MEKKCVDDANVELLSYVRIKLVGSYSMFGFWVLVLEVMNLPVLLPQGSP
jgi:hypothetical protein